MEADNFESILLADNGNSYTPSGINHCKLELSLQFPFCIRIRLQLYATAVKQHGDIYASPLQLMHLRCQALILARGRLATA